MTNGETPSDRGSAHTGADAPTGSIPLASRESTRDKARVLRESQRRRERRTRVMLGGSIAAAIVAVIAVVAVAILAAIPVDQGAPAHTRADGIPIPAPAPTPAPTISSSVGAATVAGQSVAISVYTDYLCDECGTFGRTNAAQLRTLLDTGAATLDIHPLALLTGKSQGTQYAQRAANAMACVVDADPSVALAFNDLLFARQPAEGSTGLSDAQLVDAARDAGVRSPARVGDCVRDRRFAAWVRDATGRAVDGPLAATDAAGGTPPLVLVDGTRYTGPLDDAQAFTAFLLQAAGAQYQEESTPSASSTPNATPSPTSTR